MQERTPNRQERIRHVIERRQPTLTIVLENIHDPHNVSAILRSCDATGVLKIHLVYTVDSFPDLTRHGKRSSAGTRKWVSRISHESVACCYSALHAQGFAIHASRLDARAMSLHDLDLTRPVALVFGNEHRGVSDEAVSGADGTFMIPMMGMTESLNVSVATAVSLYEALRQRKKAGLYDTPQCPPGELEELLDEWFRL